MAAEQRQQCSGAKQHVLQGPKQEPCLALLKSENGTLDTETLTNMRGRKKEHLPVRWFSVLNATVPFLLYKVFASTKSAER